MTLLPTSLVGSYAQPDWLIDRAKLAGRFPPRVRAKELWRPAPEHLEQAQDDATQLAIRAQERAGLDILTDGEMRRESYSNHFATALSGVDVDNPGTALDRSGHPNPVPRISGPIRRPRTIQVRDLEFLRANTDHVVKMTVPGPFTMSQQAQNDHYPDAEAAAMDYAAAVNAEVKDLHAAGADIVQIDEPYMQARPDAARQYGLAALNAALDGVTGTTAVHICFGYAAIIHERPGSPAAPSTRSPSRPRSPASTSACSPTSPTRRSSSGSSTSRIPRWRARRPSPPGSAAPTTAWPPSASSSPPTAA
jgi:5-methyltetrahydropteroyltriglutamate--homocysteine methyltransferase